MNNNYLISIIIPVYNLQDSIYRCLNSIMNQTYENLEILVIDDGSTDSSKNIIMEISKLDSRIHYIYKSNGGVTSARLLGIEKSHGDFIGFVDGDDEIEPDMYELLIRNSIKYDADISHCGYQMIFTDGRINYFYNSGHTVIQNNLKGIEDLLSGKKIEPGLWNKLFRKSLFHKLINSKVIDTTIKINEDLLMNYFLFKNSHKSVFEDICKYHYIVRDTSASRQPLNINKIYDPINVKKIILDDVPDSLKNEAFKAYITTLINIYNTIILEEDKCWNEEKKEVRNLLLRLANKKYLLEKRQLILFILIQYLPYLEALMYKFYCKYIQENKYE